MKKGQSKRANKAAASLLAKPEHFAKVMLGADLWKGQRDILRAIAAHRRVAVKACHASGKSYAIAIAVLWWIITHRDGIAITTAPTWLQVEHIIWGEIRRMVAQARATGLLQLPVPNQTKLELGPGNYAIGLSTDDSSRFQGFHSGNVLVVFDEAPGVRNDIFEAVEGISAGGDVRVLWLGNPVVAGGPFYEAFSSDRSRWHTITVDSFATPNLEHFTIEELRDLPPDLPEDHHVFTSIARPYLVTPRWVYDAFWKYGEDSPFWQARVRGQFPQESKDALISLQLLEKARDSHHSIGTHLYAGIDVAGPGEGETAVVVCDAAGNLVTFAAWNTPEPRGEVAAFLNPIKDRLQRVNVDSVGIGFYFGHHFLDLGYPVNLVNVGESANIPDRFANLKAELYWSLRERFQAGGVGGLTDELLISQLAAIRYRHTPRGQIAIESKEEACKRGVKSLDRAEALMLAYAKLENGLFELYCRENERMAEERKTGAAYLPPGLRGVIEAECAVCRKPLPPGSVIIQRGGEKFCSPECARHLRGF